MGGRRLKKKRSLEERIRMLEGEVEILQDVVAELEERLNAAQKVEAKKPTLKRISGSKADLSIEF